MEEDQQTIIYDQDAPADTLEYIKVRSAIYEEEQKQLQELADLRNSRVAKLRAFKLGAGLAVLLGIGGAAAVVTQDTVNEVNIATDTTLAPLLTTAPIITTIETTTTTTQPRACQTPEMALLPGDTLFGMAQMCGLALQDLISYNPEIANPDDVAAGYIVRTAPPETTSTTVVETLPPTTIVPETVPATLPPETVPPTAAVTETIEPTETAPTAPPTTVRPNDGVLSEADCIAAGGKKHSFQPGQTLQRYFMEVLQMPEAQAFRATKSQRVRDLRLVDIYADDLNDNYDLRECVPLNTDGLV